MRSIDEILEDIEKEMVEPLDCEDCAWNAGLSTALDIVKEWADESNIIEISK